MNTLLRSLQLLCVYAFFTSQLFAVQITVDPAAYTGNWRISGVTASVSGPQSLDLPVGSYTVLIGGSSAGQFQIDVNASGAITSLNPDAATAVNGVLTFNTTPVTIDPDSYAGNYDVFGVLPNGSGSRTAELVPSVSYLLRVGGSTLGTISFSVDSNGQTTTANASAATGGPGQVTLANVSISIDPQNFAGNYDIFGTLPPGSGIRSTTIVPGLSYALRIGTSTQGTIVLDIDGNGFVSSQNPDAATGGSAQITFNNTTLSINPGNYAGNYSIFGTLPSGSGSRSVIAVPGVMYLLRIANNTLGTVVVSLDGGGNASSQNNDAVTTSGASLMFNTSTVTINATNPAALYNISSVFPNTSGDTTSDLVTGVSYLFRLASGESQPVAIAAPCAVNPGRIELAGNSFDLSCGLPDADSDGVPDQSDNCPTIANPAQIDQDLDGIGNECDTDLDGDGVDNTIDNCPSIENQDQLDQDGDGSGDVCDADSDNDTVSNTHDNCPLTPNTDQADNDDDQIGDACDVDDDNDGFDDNSDNCPTIANPDQFDFDGNGQGDACDGDIDGDGVANELDHCALSPQNEPVNSAGCSAAQFLAVSCVRMDYAQHGQYVSCVAHTANQLVQQGLISQRQKARFIREAAKNK